MKELKLEIEELEERIAPIIITFTGGSVLSGVINLESDDGFLNFTKASLDKLDRILIVPCI